MRKSVLFFVKTLLVLGLVFATGCSKDEDNGGGGNNGGGNGGTVSDPAGTITVKVRNSDNGNTMVTPESCIGYFGISLSNNFYGIYANWSFARVGNVSGLGNITEIPNSGFAGQIAVEPGCGYVAKNESGGKVTYVRIYVVGWTEANTGGIIGAEIKYQSPFEPTSLAVSRDALSFTNEQGTQTVTITTDASNWTYSCNASWINVVKNNNTLSISVQENDNDAAAKRSSSITIQANEKQKNITIEQEGATVYAVGDIYNKNGVSGVVFRITTDRNGNGGFHGMIVSIQETMCAWSTVTAADEIPNLYINSNGITSMENIKEIANWESKYPAFKWCNDFNVGNVSGWYLPSWNELNELYANLTKVNATLMYYGGGEITSDTYWSSSTHAVFFPYPGSSGRTGIYNYYPMDFSSGNCSYSTDYSNINKVRAVRAF